MKKVKLILILLFVSIAASASTHEQPATNLDVLESVYASLFNNALGRVSFRDSVAAVRAVGIESSYSWLLEAQLLEALRTFGIRKTILRSKATEGDSLIDISYRPINKKIVYSKINSKKIERTISAALHLRIQKSNGALLFSKILKETKVDTLPRSKIGLIENADMEFTHGQMTKSFLSSMVQPVVVSLITGFIIYLFYSYRSK